MTTPSTAARARKAPQDHQPKSTTERSTVRGELDTSDHTFQFTADDGVTWHRSLPLTEVFTPRWARENRRRADLDGMYTAVEDAFAGNDDAMDAWDSLTFREQGEVSDALFKAMGVVTAGE